MADSRAPGPLGRSGSRPLVRDGTLSRRAAPSPGPIVSSGAPSARGASTVAPLRRSETLPPDLWRGKSGLLVQQLQALLNSKLVPSPALAVDGNFGLVTEAAVRRYQRAKNIDVDGRVASITWEYLLPPLPTRPSKAQDLGPAEQLAPKAPPLTPRTLLDWIEIELVDEEGNPVPDEAYRITLPDGSSVTGTLDSNGFARHDDIPAGYCDVTFTDLDKAAWEPA